MTGHHPWAAIRAKRELRPYGYAVLSPEEAAAAAKWLATSKHHNITLAEQAELDALVERLTSSERARKKPEGSPNRVARSDPDGGDLTEFGTNDGGDAPEAGEC